MGIERIAAFQPVLAAGCQRLVVFWNLRVDTADLPRVYCHEHPGQTFEKTF